MSFEDCPVTIENFRLHRQTTLEKKDPVQIAVTILEGSGKFEICERGLVVASGRVAILKARASLWPNIPSPDSHRQNSKEFLTSSEVYKEFRLRGYDYTGPFCGIATYNIDGKLTINERCNCSPLA